MYGAEADVNNGQADDKGCEGKRLCPSRHAGCNSIMAMAGQMEGRTPKIGDGKQDPVLSRKRKASEETFVG